MQYGLKIATLINIIILFIEGSLIIASGTVLPKGPLWCNVDSLFFEDCFLSRMRLSDLYMYTTRSRHFR